jgi:hypothetical protein
MTKDETLYEIKKLFQKYNKMRNNCNEEWKRLEESNSEYITEEQSMLNAEEEAYSKIIEDLEELIQEIMK